MRILITAGPTREPIDGVRFLSNRSSGRMGIALAEAAVEAGYPVTLLLGPVSCPHALSGPLAVHRFESSEALGRLMDVHFEDCDVLIMAAAVADFRPVQVQEGKPPRGRPPDAGRVLRLQSVPDLVAQAAARKKPQQKIVAFALEEREHLEQRARQKMVQKGVDAIVANPIETIDSEQVEPVLLVAGAQRHAPGHMSKARFATWLIARLAQL